MNHPYPIVDADIHPVLNAKRVAEFPPEPWRTRYAGGQPWRSFAGTE
jgi:hypothetical protein